jgi:hypothetical protein
MQLSELPNPGLAESLLRGGAEPAGEEASSHWRLLHRQTVARVTEAGEEIELQGAGFGHFRCHPLQRPLEALTILFNLRAASNRGEARRAIRVLRELFRRQAPELRLQLNFDAVRQALSWAALEPYLASRGPLTWCVIGDGYGIFSGLIKAIQPNSTIHLIDLPKTLVFQAVYLQMMHPEASHALGAGPASLDFVYHPAPELPELRGGIDVFVNIASMQEMGPSEVRRYFDFIRRAGAPGHLFYCCNRVEKHLPGGEVSRFDDYPWSSGDEVLFDEICPWMKYFFHLRTLPAGPRVFGARIPFLNEYGGATRHRVARLAQGGAG